MNTTVTPADALMIDACSTLRRCVWAVEGPATQFPLEDHLRGSSNVVQDLADPIRFKDNLLIQGISN